MRLATSVASIVVIAFCLSSNVFAKRNEFYPPERIDCKLIGLDHFSCEGYDRRILGEDATNAELQRDQENTFFFVYALAYFQPNQPNATVYFNYNDSKLKTVRLKTTDVMLHPDVHNGSWKKLQEGVYACNESYMTCSLTTAMN